MGNTDDPYVISRIMVQSFASFACGLNRIVPPKADLGPSESEDRIPNPPMPERSSRFGQDSCGRKLAYPSWLAFAGFEVANGPLLVALKPITSGRRRRGWGETKLPMALGAAGFGNGYPSG